MLGGTQGVPDERGAAAYTLTITVMLQVNTNVGTQLSGSSLAHSTGREHTLVMGNDSTSVALSLPRCVLFSFRISSSVATHTPCARAHPATRGRSQAHPKPQKP